MAGSTPSSAEYHCARLCLRRRWELASVLNFLHVFEPVVQSGLALTAEEIEMALISPDNNLPKLHIALLKGIPPASKNIRNPDAWVTVLYRRLAPWWPWVAEGDIPFTLAKGQEIANYTELDFTSRLLILKALCEVRALQTDILSYIDYALKDGKELSNFRKNLIAGDQDGTIYWYDGNSVIGHRLYKEIIKVEFKQNIKEKGQIALPMMSSEWETLATNLEEFRKISEKLASAETLVEAKVREFVANHIVPVLEKLEKKKERAIKRLQRQEVLLNAYHTSFRNGRPLRSCKPISYTCDEYDRCINEAIKESKKVVLSQGKSSSLTERGSEYDDVHKNKDENDDRMRNSTKGIPRRDKRRNTWVKKEGSGLRKSTRIAAGQCLQKRVASVVELKDRDSAEVIRLQRLPERQWCSSECVLTSEVGDSPKKIDGLPHGSLHSMVVLDSEDEASYTEPGS
ncbi:hypothetical protein H6P81_003797 [Aristolochia fimbriata]|uniref:DDT domain-containing protein DDR4 n=1 Tax=Aristolochia fimbriata TaxID=158543 RepID=A0AAV7FFG2_ARIFI|nr:hypothetical protein H6P81_003797 [Aristolochia fimbriata]